MLPPQSGGLGQAQGCHMARGPGCCWWASGVSHKAQQYLIAPLSRKRQWRNSQSSEGRGMGPLLAKMLPQVLRAVPKRASQGAFHPVQPRLPPPQWGPHPPPAQLGGAGRTSDNSLQAFLELVGRSCPGGEGILAQQPCKPGSDENPGLGVAPGLSGQGYGVTWSKVSPATAQFSGSGQTT